MSRINIRANHRFLKLPEIAVAPTMEHDSEYDQGATDGFTLGVTETLVAFIQSWLDQSCILRSADLWDALAQSCQERAEEIRRREGEG